MIDCNQKRVLAAFAAISLMLSVLAGCHPIQHQPLPQQTLMGRIDQYYNALQAKAYTKSILFHAHRNKQKPTGSTSLGSKLSLNMASYEIQSMHVKELDARVLMHVTLSGHENQYDIMIVDHWQFIGDEWLVVDASQRPVDEAIKTLDHDVWQSGIKW